MWCEVEPKKCACQKAVTTLENAAYNVWNYDLLKAMEAQPALGVSCNPSQN
jgi:hypothetical protein